MLFQKKRILIACAVAVIWGGWAVWANVPHFYDIQVARAKLASVMPNATLEPASAGFPFAYMRYEYSQNGALLPYDFAPSAALPNILFCLTGITGALLLVFRIRRLSIGLVGLFCVVGAPAVLLYVLLNGPHSDVVSYLYLTPVALLLACLATDGWRTEAGRTTEPTEVPVAGPVC
ncbi:hypothetical protein FF011L_23490 [Roseimaritima multifibrata]|uniref:Uncharacterized protein n=1 Tax=Roseimaritima multifibrata TaxID=1930274 RepID=A0A517MFF8_9BACT|nr:hypothetical protein [Roseimaritima multifibrata]QDS93576.1 hypothetical protein FF011L_23490 [Roseimaritima multifibrata]